MLRVRRGVCQCLLLLGLLAPPPVGGQGDCSCTSTGVTSAIQTTATPLASADYGLISQTLQGSSVSLSSDGSLLAVGGPGDNSNVGATWVFRRYGSTWEQMADMPLKGAGSVGASQQGWSVSLSSNGTVLAVGGPGNNGGIGATWVFKQSGGAWVEMAGVPLVGRGAQGTPAQGYSVCLAPEGDVLAVGGPHANLRVGAAWIFRYNGSAWVELAGPLVGTGFSGDSYQGNSVSLSSNGTVLAVGGPQNRDDVGATWVFRRHGNAWAEMAGMPLVGGNTTVRANQGTAVSLSSDGAVLAIGGPSNDHLPGAAWVFRFDGSAWLEEGGMPLVGTGHSSATNQGFSVSLSSDGSTLAVGGPGNNNYVGAVWAFRSQGPGGAWAELADMPLVGSGYTGAALQGSAVSLSGDGAVLAVGGPYNLFNFNTDTLDAFVGSAWTFNISTCAPGTFLSAATGACTAAGPGTYSPGYLTSAIACLPGSFAALPGASSCQDCPPGHFSSAAGSSACQACAPGTFTNASGASACTACGPGTHCPNPAATSSAACQACPAGSYSATAQAAACSPCPAGTFARQPGAPSRAFCQPCPAGQTAPAGSAACTATVASRVAALLRVVGPVLCGVLLTLAWAYRQQLAAGLARWRAWRERARKDAIAGQQLEALLTIHGVSDPVALAAVQVRGRLQSGLRADRPHLLDTP
jgi:hypothetical protein